MMNELDLTGNNDYIRVCLQMILKTYHFCSIMQCTIGRSFIEVSS